MKKFLLGLIAVMAFGFIACNAQSNPDVIGKNLFAVLKILSSSDAENARNKLATNFLKKEDGYNLFWEIKSKDFNKGVSDWSKIEYVNYIHKEFIKNGVKYSSGCLVVKLNGNSDYAHYGIFLLNIQVGDGYKVLQCRDNWSRDSTIPWGALRQRLDEIAEEWVD